MLGNCPTGWENFEKNCYQFKESNKLPWTAARAACQRQGSDLVSITSRHEQDFIAYHYRSKSAFGNLWIGLYPASFPVLFNMKGILSKDLLFNCPDIQ